MRHLGVATRANGSDDAFEASPGRIVDDPPAELVLVHLVDLDVELGLVLEAVALPELLDLADNLLAVGVAALPPDGRVEAVHQGMDLETGRVVHSLYVQVSIGTSSSSRYTN